MKMWPQKWKASESPGSTRRADGAGRRAAAISAPPTRARKPRREVLAAATRSRARGAAPPGPVEMLRTRHPRRDPLQPFAGASRGRDDALELREVVEGALGEHRPVATSAIAKGLPGMSSAPPQLRLGGLVEDADVELGLAGEALDRGLEARQRWQPSEVKTASASPRSCAAGSARAAGRGRRARGPRRRSRARRLEPRRRRSMPTSRASASTATASPAQAAARRRGRAASHCRCSSRRTETRAARRRPPPAPGCGRPPSGSPASESRSRRRERRPGPGAARRPSARRTAASARRRRRPPRRSRSRRPSASPSSRAIRSPRRRRASGPSAKPKLASAARLDAETPAWRALPPRALLPARRGKRSRSSLAAQASSSGALPAQRSPHLSEAALALHLLLDPVAL